jgi:serine protease inhibitor
MMSQPHLLHDGATDQMQVLNLPYGPSGSLSMLILLPKKTEGFSDLEKKLTSENLEKWSAGLRPRRVNVFLPFSSLSLPGPARRGKRGDVQNGHNLNPLGAVFNNRA